MRLTPATAEPSPTRLIVIATATVIVAVMPSFLTGASGVLLRRDLDFTEAGLGVAVSAFFGATALTSVLGGRVAERLGGRFSLMLISLGGGGVLLSIALLAQRWIHLVLLLIVGGVFNGMAQPASNLVLSRGVPERQGLALGIKQAAVPMTTLLAGVSVPAIGINFGWRWSFVLATVGAVAIASLTPRSLQPPPGPVRRRDGSSPREGDAATAPLVLLAIAAGAGMAAATSLGSFLVESGVAAGLTVAVAGWVQVAGSAAGAASRILAGWSADRWRGAALLMVAGMILSGALGYGMLATGDPLLVLAGTVIAYALGWGWTGLIMVAVVRFNPNAPAAATGILMTGSATGAGSGPLIFGLIVSRYSYQAAWTFAACLALVATVLVLSARRWLLIDRGRREATS